MKNKTPLFIKIANGRFKVWKEQPEKMERIRQIATNRAKEVKQKKHNNLVNIVRNWPDNITTVQLYELINQLKYVNKKGKRMLELSMINRLRCKGLIQYDTGLGVWKNMTKLT